MPFTPSPVEILQNLIRFDTTNPPGDECECALYIRDLLAKGGIESTLLALNLAHYELRYGELPLDEALAALAATKPNDAQAELLTRGMENLVGLLGNVLSGLGEGKH